VTTFGQDGVHNPPTGRGFEVFRATVGIGKRLGLDHLNPQTQGPRSSPDTCNGRRPRSPLGRAAWQRRSDRAEPEHADPLRVGECRRRLNPEHLTTVEI
jgi:hypothetical protein